MTDHQGPDEATARRTLELAAVMARHLDSLIPLGSKDRDYWIGIAARQLQEALDEATEGDLAAIRTHATSELPRLEQDAELAALRAEVATLRENAVAGGNALRGMARRSVHWRQEADRWQRRQWNAMSRVQTLTAELSALRDGRVPANRRENADHNAVMTGVARVLDREGSAWEQVEEVTDACLTYVENHHGVRCPGEMCPNSYRGENAELDLIQHYLRAHSEAAVKYLRAHGLYDPGPGHAPEQGEPEEVPWAACGDRRTWHDGHVTTCTAKGPHEHHSNGDGARWAATDPAPVSASLDPAREILARLVENHYGANGFVDTERLMAEARALLGREQVPP